MSDHAANYLISTLEHTNGKDGAQPLRGKKS
jgi:hypothetical protein